MHNYIQAEGGTQVGEPWRGSPITCDFCKTESPICFIDGRVQGGTSWAIMCLDCFKTHGVGIGSGNGQKYCQKQ